MKYIETYGQTLNEDSNMPPTYMEAEIIKMVKDVNKMTDRKLLYGTLDHSYFLSMTLLTNEFPSHLITIQIPDTFWKDDTRIKIMAYHKTPRVEDFRQVGITGTIDLNKEFNTIDELKRMLQSKMLIVDRNEQGFVLNNRVIRFALNYNRKPIISRGIDTIFKNVKLYNKYWDYRIKIDPRIYKVMIDSKMATKQLIKKWVHLGADFGFLD